MKSGVADEVQDMTIIFATRRPTHSRAVIRIAALSLAAMLVSFAASAQPGTPEQKRACTPDVYRLCAAEIPSVAAITACLRRKKASLSDACRAVFEQ